MNRIDQLISEIKEFKNQSNHRSALQIYNILENNKTLFLSKIDKDYFNPMLNNFEKLSESNPGHSNSADFKRDYERAFDLLAFHMNRI